MSYFDHKQFHIQMILEELQDVIDKNGKELTREELKEKERYIVDPEYFKKYPEELKHWEYPEEMISEMETCVDLLKQAYKRVYLLDKYLSGDIGEENYFKRLTNEEEKV